jgi:hypothetical protein
MDTLPICKALSKQSGQRCKNFASNGKTVCHIHGGRSSGAKTPEGKQRSAKSNLKHGRYTEMAKEERKEIRALINLSKSCLRDL